MSVMKIAGNANNVVKGVSVTSEGYVLTVKKWENEIIKIYDDTPTASGTYVCDPISTGDSGGFSLRVSNYTAQDITLGLYTDVLSNTFGLRDGEGNLISYTVEADKKNVMITPDDLPQLQWLAKLRLYFILPEASESGAVTIYAVVKR